MEPLVILVIIGIAFVIFMVMSEFIWPYPKEGTVLEDKELIGLAMDAIETELETFQWAYPSRGDNRGELNIDRDNNLLQLVVWCRDNDDPDSEEVKPLLVTKPVTSQGAKIQIQSIIHDYLCHEADEQMWFGEDRPFYPHEVNDG